MSTHLSVTSKAIVCVGCFRTAWRSRANWPTLMWPPGPINTWTVGSPCRWTQLRARAVTTTATTAEARWKLCTSVTRVSHLTWRWGTGPGSLDANMLLCSRDIEFVFFLQISQVKSEAAVSMAPSMATSIASSLRRRLSAFSPKVNRFLI